SDIERPSPTLAPVTATTVPSRSIVFIAFVPPGRRHRACRLWRDPHTGGEASRPPFGARWGFRRSGEVIAFDFESARYIAQGGTPMLCAMLKRLACALAAL